MCQWSLLGECIYKPLAAIMESKSLSSSCSLEEKTMHILSTDHRFFIILLLPFSICFVTDFFLAIVAVESNRGKETMCLVSYSTYRFLSSSKSSTNAFLCSTISTSCLVFCCMTRLSCFDGSVRISTNKKGTIKYSCNHHDHNQMKLIRHPKLMEGTTTSD